MKVFNKVIVVTGGGSGIGRELVLDLLRRGARVATVDISEKTLQETQALAGGLGDKLSLHVVNIADRAAVEALPEAVITAHGSVDGLINNAGIIQKFIRFNDLPTAEIERVMNINFYGAIYMTKVFLPYLLKRPEGHIVNVSSMGGFLPVPGQTLYGASKAAVKLFTEGLNSELHDTKVGVTVAFPGATSTNIAINSGAMMPEQRETTRAKSKIKMTSAIVAAGKIVDAMERNKYRVLIGNDSKMMDFFYRLMPRHAARIIYNQMKSILPE